MGRQEQPKKRNQVAREMLERGGAGAGKHQVDHETAFQKGWRRTQKHKKSWDDQDFLDENTLFEDLKEGLEDAIELSTKSTKVLISEDLRRRSS